MIFVTLANNEQERWCARLLVRSLRAFGGECAGSPVWIYDTGDEIDAWKSLEADNVRAFHLDVPDSIRETHFPDKVVASALAEEAAADETDTLVWLNPECLVLKPPAEFQLEAHTDIAIRPVHIRNIGSPAAEEPDAYWKAIYDAVGLTEAPMEVESFVDGQLIRAYFNCCVYSYRPQLGLSARWLELFEQLVGDREFQSHACTDHTHQLFLHQAVHSALIASMILPERIRLLPPTYSYPVHLYHLAPESKRAALDDLTVPIIDTFSDEDLAMNGMPVSPKLRAWIEEAARSI